MLFHCCFMLFHCCFIAVSLLFHCCFMLFHAVSCCFIAVYAVSLLFHCYFMLFHAVSCCFMLFHAASCCFMLFHAISCCFMLFNAVSLLFHCCFIAVSLVFQGVSLLCFMLFHGVSLLFHGVSLLCFMVFQGVSLPCFILFHAHETGAAGTSLKPTGGPAVRYIGRNKLHGCEIHVFAFIMMNVSFISWLNAINYCVTLINDRSNLVNKLFNVYRYHRKILRRTQNW